MHLYRVILHPNKIYRDHVKGQSIVIHTTLTNGPERASRSGHSHKHHSRMSDIQKVKFRFKYFAISEKLKIEKLLSCVYEKSRLGGFQPRLPLFQRSISV